MPGGLLTKRGLVLFKVEATPGVDPLPTAANDAVLVSAPEYTTDPQVLERDFVTTDLSKFEHIIGRVVAGFKFVVDLRGNGSQNSGLVADAPMLARMMRACGYELLSTDGTGAKNLTSVIDARGNAATTKVSWAKGGTVTVVTPTLYTVEVVTAGASGVAEVLVTNNNVDEDDLSAAVAETITTGVALTLGAKGGTITPTFTGDLALGDKFQVLALPVGITAKPISDGFETGTIYMWRDGNLHVGNNAMGTFTIEATAGDFARVTFNFTASFVAAEATPMPEDAVYEETLPPQVELSLLTWGGNRDLIADKWTFDQGNDIQARMDVNARQGYRGSRIADRAPKGGFTPEAELETDQPFWADYLAAKAKTFTVRCGTEAGNQIVLWAPRAQTSELSYGDRNGLLTYDKSIAFKRGLSGNDETIWHFC